MYDDYINKNDGSTNNENKSKKLTPILIGAASGLLVFAGVLLLTPKNKKEEPSPTPAPIVEVVEENNEDQEDIPFYNPTPTPKPSGSSSKPTPTPKPTTTVTVGFTNTNYTCAKNKKIKVSVVVCNDNIKSVTANNNNVFILGYANITTGFDKYCRNDTKCMSLVQDKKCHNYLYEVSCKTSGTTELTAKTAKGKTAKAKVKIVDKYVAVKSVTLGEVTGRVLKKGSTKRLTATINPSNATNKSVEWVSSNPNVLTVDQNGLVTAVGKGKAKITAVVYSDDKDYHKDTVELVGYVNDSDITANNLIYFHRLSGSCSAGGTKEVTVYTQSFGRYGSGIASIKSLDTSIATVSKSKNQPNCKNCIRYTIKCKNVASSTTIEVKSKAGGTAKYTIKVNSATMTPAKPTAAFNKTSYVCGKGDKIIVKTKICDDKLKSASTDNKKVATINITAINDTFKCENSEKCINSAQNQVAGCKTYEHAVECVGTGSTNLIVKGASGKTAKATIKVVDKYVPVKSVTMGNVGDRILKKGTTKQLPLTINPSNATNKKVYWSSSDKKVLTVDSNGKITVVGKGRAKITARVYKDDNISFKDTVEFVTYEKESQLKPNDLIYFFRLSGSCSVGKTKSVNIYTEGLNKYAQGLKEVKSLDTSIATVEKGKVENYGGMGVYAYVIHCKKTGKTTIEAKSSAGGTAKYTITVK